MKFKRFNWRRWLNYTPPTGTLPVIPPPVIPPPIPTPTPTSTPLPDIKTVLEGLSDGENYDIPYGTYIIKDYIAINSHNNLINGNGSTLKSAINQFFPINLIDAQYGSNLTLNNIILDQDEKNQPKPTDTGVSWLIRSGEGTILNNVSLRNGVDCGLVGSSKGLIMNNCTISNVGEHPLYLTGIDGIVVNNLNVDTWAMLFRGYSPKIQNCSNVIFTDCNWIQGNPPNADLYGAVIAKCTNLKFLRNTWKTNLAYLSTVPYTLETGGSSNVVFDNCAWFNFGNAGIDPFNEAILINPTFYPTPF